MPTRNVVVTEQQVKMIKRLVASGRYQNASEVLRDGLRIIHERDKAETVKLKALKDAIAVGVADIEAGRYVTFENRREIDAFFRNRFRNVVTGAKNGRLK
jgi:antitoxin ParD1/3/4